MNNYKQVDAMVEEWKGAGLAKEKIVANVCEAELGWKRTTTYTVLKRLCEKGIFQNDGGTVTSLLSREDFYARQSNRYVEETFHGSLPAFFAAFTRGKPLTEEERAEIRRMIDGAE